MSDAASLLKLDGFERIDAGPRTALLRVAGTTSRDAALAQPPVLIVHDGRRQHRISPLPGPPAPARILRVAYPAPLELLGDAVAFSLELADGSSLTLPAPGRREQRPVPDAAAQLRAKLERESEAVRTLDIALSEREAVLAERELALEAAEAQLVEARRGLVDGREIAASLAAELDEARIREEMLSEVVQAETAKREELIGQLAAAQAARADAESSFAELQEQARGAERRAARRLVSDAAGIETITRAAESRARDQAFKEIQAAQRAARRRSQSQNRRRRRPQGRPS